MNTQETTLAIFTRMSRFVVKKHLKVAALNSYDYVGNLINNMQEINQTLMTAAIVMIKRVRDEKDVNIEQLTSDFRKVIHGSVSEYAQRA